MFRHDSILKRSIVRIVPFSESMSALHLLIVCAGSLYLADGFATDPSLTSFEWSGEPFSRDFNGGPSLPSTPSQCNFGRGRDLVPCGWTDAGSSSLRWQLSTGRGAYFLGGPSADASGDQDGGYILIETSGGASDGAMLNSPIQNGTQPDGKCIVFQFAINGPNSEQLSLFMQPTGPGSNDTLTVGQPKDTLWKSRGAVQQEWQTAAILYSFGQPHQLIFQASAGDQKPPHRRMQGHIVLDNIDLGPENVNEPPVINLCVGYCNFDGGLCGWTNDAQHDFNWKLGRGSINRATGPSRDHSTFGSGNPSRGYVFIDSGYPRRPGDKAKLVSPQMQPTDADRPLCLGFWTHMFGNGIGTLRVTLRYVDGNERHLWSLTGEAGNTWHQAQLTVASPIPFQIVFEGTIGRNHLGDIALDDIVFHKGSCPGSPQTAVVEQGDCNFELDECGWSNGDQRVDDIDWTRSMAETSRQLPFTDHTTSTGKGYVMSPGRSSVQRPGDRSWFISPLFNVTAPDVNNRCLTFWYFMNEAIIDPAGPGLGSLGVYIRPEDAGVKQQPVAIWRLRNHQAEMWMMARASIQATKDYRVIIEGLWGSSRSVGSIAIDDISFYDGICTTYPAEASPMPMECSFQRDTCQWSAVKNETNANVDWVLASVSRRPANLMDHTFAAPRGYVYFDVFNQGNDPEVIRMVGPKIPPATQSCFTFWFAAFGPDGSTQLRVLIANPDFGTETEIWSLRVNQFESLHSGWNYGQVGIGETGSDQSVVVFEGRASNGGFAVDDVALYRDACQSRPPSSVPQL